jgi:hypothetical protein
VTDADPDEAPTLTAIADPTAVAVDEPTAAPCSAALPRTVADPLDEPTETTVLWPTAVAVDPPTALARDKAVARPMAAAVANPAATPTPIEEPRLEEKVGSKIPLLLISGSNIAFFSNSSSNKLNRVAIIL